MKQDDERVREAVRRLKCATVAYLAKKDPWDLKEALYWANVLKRELEERC